jgi:hypothetical protein
MDRHSPVVAGDEASTYAASGSERAVLFRCICPPRLDA